MDGPLPLKEVIGSQSTSRMGKEGKDGVKAGDIEMNYFNVSHDGGSLVLVFIVFCRKIRCDTISLLF